ncbi:MAG: hypothetical protein U0167_13655 [bacterium]
MGRSLVSGSIVAIALLGVFGCLPGHREPALATLGEATLGPARGEGAADQLLPRTEITFGPADLGAWGTDVEFRWASRPGYAIPRGGFRYALTSLSDYVRDGGHWGDPASLIFAWLDTLTYYPDFSGGYFTDSLVWHRTQADSVEFANVVPTDHPDHALFAVRALDHTGAEDLVRVANTRFFHVYAHLDGPCVHLVSDLAGSWDCNGLPSVRDVFRGSGLRFHWSASPGPNETAVTGFSYAVDDTASWPPYSQNTDFPPGGDAWTPDLGPHTLFVRAIDEGGAVSVLPARLMVYAGPRGCSDPKVLVVLDTVPAALAGGLYTIWPRDYRTVERALVQYWFDGSDYQLFETQGTSKPPASALDCASSVFWFLSADVADWDSSVLLSYSRESVNPLPSWIASGGNLMICGLQPVASVRYMQDRDTGAVTPMQGPPWTFAPPGQPVSHWIAAQFGIARIDDSIGGAISDGYAADRLRLCRSRVTSGPHPYPDLPFDPLTWPQGPVQRGFGFYDRGVVPRSVANPAEVIYTANDSNDAIAIRRLTSPGVNGNLVYAGFHPYFVGRPEFRQFIQAVLADFGEDAP